MGLMKELGTRASDGNREAITALRHNAELLAARGKERPLSEFPWAVPSAAECAEHGVRMSDEEYEQMELDLEPQEEAWPPKERERFENWLDAQAARDDVRLADMENPL